MHKLSKAALRPARRALAAALACLALSVSLPAGATSNIDWNAAVAQGAALRQQGELQKSVDLLRAAQQEAETPELQLKATGELGASLLQAHRYDEADAALHQAYQAAIGAERARFAVYLGNLATIRKHADEARRYYREALDLAPGDADIQVGVGLNLVRLAPPAERLAQLAAVSAQLAKAGAPANAARHHLNLGNQAAQLGEPGVELAYRHLDQARRLAQQGGDARLAIEALDALAQLYEDRGRGADALALTRQAIERAQTAPAGSAADLLINLEWRAGRLLKAANAPAPALAAFQRAVSQIEAVRQDIPIEYEDGRSSFRATLEPIYLGYVDLLLQQVDQQPADVKATQLRQAVSAIELIRQTELQDFLGDRCSVEAVQGGGSGGIAAGTAVLYPVILPDRVELLLKTGAGVVRRTAPVSSAALRKTAASMADALRNGLDYYLGPAQRLNGWLLQPFDDVFAAQQVRSLVVVPDGALRLVPLAALHDGKHFAIEKYAISMVTGLSLTNTAAPAGHDIASLVVGVSEPGPVVEKLSHLMASQILEPNASSENATRGLAHTRQVRAIRAVSTAASGDPATRKIDDLRKRLALPGVKEELQALGGILHGANLLNSDFTVDHFRDEAESGEYRIVHIASHGVFGGSAETSFIMAYDDLLTMNGLQALLRAEKFKKAPIELLSLSACQTAEGNDRAPLGISGAAIKARAKSVLGTLWPVEDDAAQTIMKNLYSGVTAGHLSKTEALRQAQLKLISNPDSAHPFYWAPFVLIGNWM